MSQLIEQWLQSIAPSELPHDYHFCSMSKDQSSEDDRDDALPPSNDLDTTPRGPRTSIMRDTLSAASRTTRSGNRFTATATTAATSSWFEPPATVASHPRRNDDIQQPHALPQRPFTRTPSPPKRSQARLGSPSKRVRTSDRLDELERPVRFRKASGWELPADAQPLYKELLAASHQRGILPRSVESKLTEFERSEISPHMWQDQDDGTGEGESEGDCDCGSDSSGPPSLRMIRYLVNAARESANLNRGEAAWNARVHDPTLCLLLAEFPSVAPEVITMAKIAKPYRPSFRGGGGAGDSNLTPSRSQSASSVSGGGSSVVSGTSNATDAAAGSGTSAHKMVDFALVLKPDSDAHLARAIDGYMATTTQDWEFCTVNQTTYAPLRRRPAPIFIETKTSAGNSEAAKAQLGVWMAAYHGRLMAMMEEKKWRLWERGADAVNESAAAAAAASTPQRIITLPVVQWINGLWEVSFVVDMGTSIDILDVNLRVGDVNTVVGMYQLRKTLTSLVGWMEQDFRSWFMSVL